MLAVAITGPPGAGKSSAATLVHDALGDAGVANALLELDELDRAYPPVGFDRQHAHAAALAASYRAAGHELLIVTATLEDDAWTAALRTALGAEELLLVRLEAAPATLERRIRAREPAGWSGLEQLVASARALAGRMEALAGVDLVLSTEDAEPAAVAARIEEALRERLDARPVLPAWPPGTTAILATGGGAAHAIPISTARRAGPRTILLALAESRGSLARLRADPRCALAVLAAGDVAFTAHGRATIGAPAGEGVVAVRIDVDAIQDHARPTFRIDAGVAWRWTDPEAARRDAAVHAALERMAAGG